MIRALLAALVLYPLAARFELVRAELARSELAGAELVMNPVRYG